MYSPFMLDIINMQYEHSANLFI